MIKCKTIMLLVTYGCNLNCTYCYEPKKNQKRMTLEGAKQYVSGLVHNLAPSYDEFEVQLMGGEPMMAFPLIKDLSEWIWQETWPLPIKQVFAPTNGTILNTEMRDWLTKHKEKICLGLSFDGTRLMQNFNRSQSSARVDLAFFAKNWLDQSVKMTVFSSLKVSSS